MKKLLVACAVFGLTAPAFADTLEGAYGNTVTVTTASGQTATYHFNADNTYMMMAGETHLSGVWAINGEELCLTPEGGEPACAPYVGDKNVGDTWTQTGSDGSEITVTITEGR